MNTRKAEIRLLAAVGGIVVAGNDGEFGTRQPMLSEVRARTFGLTDREFAETLRRLVQTGAVIRTGRGDTATLTRDFAAWHGQRAS